MLMNHPKNKMWGQQITVSYIPMEGSSRAINNRWGSSAASCPRTTTFGALAAGGDQCHRRSTRRGAASLRPCGAGERASRRRALRAGATAGKEEEAGRVSSPPPARKKRQLGFRRAPVDWRKDAAQGKVRRRPPPRPSRATPWAETATHEALRHVLRAPPLQASGIGGAGRHASMSGERERGGEREERRMAGAARCRRRRPREERGRETEPRAGREDGLFSRTGRERKEVKLDRVEAEANDS